MDMVAIRAAIEELEQGRCVAIFPEGTRSEDGELKEFKRGWWVILERTGADVLPVAIDGAFDVWPINRPMRFRGWIELEVGEPISGQSLLDMKAERGVVVLRDRIGELRGRCRARIAVRSGNG
jgi:1-acyl-sn-glycerol-3-phosphate acyltransferase